MAVSLAIDFGTTNSVLAQWNDQQQTTKLLQLPDISQDGDPPLIPSLVYVKDGKNGEILLGQSAKDILNTASQDKRIFRDFKRGLLTSDEAANRSIDKTNWNHADAGKYFVHALIHNLPFPQSEVDQLVLTVPVTAFSHYLNWLTDTFSELQVRNVRVIDESSAAALGYAVTEPGALVLVFDFGGGSLDLSLVKLPKDRTRLGGFLGQVFGVGAGKHAARVIAKSGQILGGGDVDRWLRDEITQRTSLSPQSLEQNTIQLLNACEAAKIQLSATEQAEIKFPNGNHAQTITITRTELETLLHKHQFSKRIHQAIQKILNTARREGIFREDIQNILLVGGMSQMPLVQETLASFFPHHTLRCDKPFTAVVEGALQVAAGLGLEDYLIHSYGLRYFDIKNRITTFDEILPAGTRYPTDKPIEVLLGTAFESQQTIELLVGEIDAASISTIDINYEQGEAVFVARLNEQNQAIRPINQHTAAQNQLRLKTPHPPGEARLRASFSLDENRQLFVTVTDLYTQELLLENALLADLAADELQGQITIISGGHEPALASQTTKKLGTRLSIRQLANLLSANALPPEAYSIESAAVMLNHKDLYVRYEAARMLGRRGDRSARLVLQEALRNGHPPTRASAIRHAYGLTWFTAQPLFQIALADAEWRVRESAIYALCDCRDPRAYQLAAQALQIETEEEVFAAAAWGLRHSRDPEAVSALMACLQAESREIKEQALESLGNNGSQEAGNAIRQVLIESKKPAIQYASALSFLEISGEEAFPDLINLIENGPPDTRLALLKAIFHASNYLGIQLGKSQYCDHLLNLFKAMLNDPNAEIRLATIWPLAWMRHTKADKLLHQAYKAKENHPYQQDIRQIAVNLGSPAAKSFEFSEASNHGSV